MTPPSRLGRHLKLITPPYGKSRTPTLVIVLAGLLLAGMLTAGPASHPAYARTADSSIEFAENGTRPVGTFWAYDQDGDPIVWSLSGPDDGLFAIDGGVLSFRDPPDYEDPQSAARGGRLAEKNVYRVTVEASGGAHDVAVTVTDVDESGTVSIDRRQPQVDRPLGASLSDEDEGVTAERWQWSRSGDRATWTDIEGATSPRRRPEPADVGMYLRAMVSYSDGFGASKTAWAVSAYRVEARTLSNAAPSFAGQGDDEDSPNFHVARSVAENTAVGRNVGRPVSATDEDDDILFYELLDTPDLEDGGGDARFAIDSASGQIRVGRALGADAGEPEDEDSTSLTGGPALPEDEDAGVAGNSEYVLRVRVSDPSTASATVNVIVRVTEVNEAPAFDEDAPTVLRVKENADPPVITFGDDDSPVNAGTFAVTDQDGADTARAYSVTGEDREVLAFDGSDILGFMAGHGPDFEEQSSYSITVMARSGAGHRRLSTTLDVTIEVVDGEDVGEISLSQRQPQGGITVHATVSDPDGGVRIIRWVWERSDEITFYDDGTPSAECRDDPGTPGIGVVGGWAPIDGATSLSYTPASADVGRCLRATAVYRDNIGEADEQAMEVAEAPVQSSKTANAAPKFVDQDLNSPGDQSDRTSRKVAENTKPGQSIGTPVSAFDDDGELLIYTISGADAGFFGISRNDGQLKTKASLNYEARTRYTVVMTATDPSGAEDSIRVTINVTNVHDPVQITGVSSVRYSENGTGPVAVFRAFDEGEHTIRWSVSGRDDDLFAIEGGVLAFREPPNYEDPQSAASGARLSDRNVYRVTVRAAGGAHDVAVTVKDVDEAGTVSMSRPQPQVAQPLEAGLSDEDDGVTAERWQWARSVDGRTWTDVEGATTPRRPPAPGDVGMYLRATVTYSDGFGAGKTASAVSANPVEARTLFNAAPSFAGQDDDEATPHIDVARSVSENTAAGMPVGEPVSASDADEDILFYELLDTPDLEDGDGDARFTIDGLSGQIRAGRALGADPGETEDEDSTALTGIPALPDDEEADGQNNGEYVLRVRVSDPSTASATVNVIVRVTEVNEPPAFDEDAPALLSVVENADSPVVTVGHGGPLIGADTFAVTDQDGRVTGPGGYDDTTYTYSVSGADRGVFAIDGTTGMLSFKAGHEPDFEEQNSYSITVEARSGEGARRLTATLDVTVEVVDGEDAGAVVLSQRQPQVGIVVHATASDDDGGVTVTRWVWELSDVVTVSERGAPSAECRDDPATPGIDVVGGWTPISGASSAVYAPRPADAGRCLRATAFYTDNIGAAGERVTGVLEVPVGGHGSSGTGSVSDGGFVNAAPVFPDQDFLTEGDQSDSTSRKVAENTKAGRNIGSPVSARDDDGDLLIYTLTGADAASFGISRNSGQLKTKAALNYEVRDSYTVVVTATDPSGAMDSIVVTINVTDEDDPAVITVLKR